MRKIGFDAQKYIQMQYEHIVERINEGHGERLYLEFGGKLVHDKHAMRVLPGFDENAKIKLLQKLCPVLTKMPKSNSFRSSATRLR